MTREQVSPTGAKDTVMTPKIWQFWDSKAPPPEVQVLMSSWITDHQFEYKAFDVESASDFIRHHYGDRTLDAFHQCKFPAMKADLFRYCILFVEGGVYVDADTKNGGGLANLVAPSERALLMNRQNKIANDFLYFKNSNDRLLEKIIDQALKNISEKSSNNVWKVTGPGIITDLYNNGDQSLFEGIDIKDVKQIREVVQFQWDLEYKQESTDWRSALSGGESIFSAAPKKD